MAAKKSKSVPSKRAPAKAVAQAKPARRSPAKAKSRTASTGTNWRAATLERVRALILEADPAMVEERKWKKATNPAGVPVFSHDGIVCTGEQYEEVVKLTFMHGASLPDPAKLFNTGFDGNVRRAIDIREGETIDAAAFKALIKAAVAHNRGGK